MKIVTVIGARPQFIKAAPVSRAIHRHNLQTRLARERIAEVLIHTGQHYDEEMSAVFFQELEIPKPDYELGVGSGPHGWQTSQLMLSLRTMLGLVPPL